MEILSHDELKAAPTWVRNLVVNLYRTQGIRIASESSEQKLTVKGEALSKRGGGRGRVPIALPDGETIGYLRGVMEAIAHGEPLDTQEAVGLKMLDPNVQRDVGHLLQATHFVYMRTTLGYTVNRIAKVMEVEPYAISVPLRRYYKLREEQKFHQSNLLS